MMMENRRFGVVLGLAALCVGGWYDQLQALGVEIPTVPARSIASLPKMAVRWVRQAGTVDHLEVTASDGVRSRALGRQDGHRGCCVAQPVTMSFHTGIGRP